MGSKTRKRKVALFIFLFIGLSFVVGAQVIGDTQVIDLAEKARDFFIEATKGNIIGQETINKFGHNENLGTSFEDIQNEGGTLIFLQSAELLTISSSDAADTLLGANATSIELQGLDGNFAEITEIVNLSGTTEVNTTQEFIRVYRSFVLEVGTYTASNAGTISVIAAISGTKQIEIGIGEGQSQTTHYTVPAGKEVIISGIYASVDSGKSVDIRFLIRKNADDIIPPVGSVRLMREIHGLDGPYAVSSRANLRMDEKTDLWFIAKTTSGATSEVEVNYDILQYAIGS